MQVVQEVGSRQGIRERFATQRQYTDISVSFYVTHDYTSLRLFPRVDKFYESTLIGQIGQPFPNGQDRKRISKCN